MAETKKPFLPPRPVIRFAWKVHKALYSRTGGRLGLRKYTPDQEGLAELVTTGRRSGQKRSVMIAYFEDGDDFVTMAMNGWDVAEPAWWLNLQANERALLTHTGRAIEIIGRAALEGEEHDRLWERWRELDKNVDKFAAHRTEGTAVVILSPVTAKGGPEAT